MTFSNAAVEANYRRLGFVPDGATLKLRVGPVRLTAIQHPLGGVEVVFTVVEPDMAAQFEIWLPDHCSTELIAGMIYSNIAKNLGEDAMTWKRHFQDLKVPLFQ
jgi:hypothetical protein